MTPNLDFFIRQIDIRRWRFIVALCSVVVMVYLFQIVDAVNDGQALRSAMCTAVITIWTLSLIFHLTLPPRYNRYWVVIMSTGMETAVGGPYTKDRAYDVFFNVGNLIQEDEYSGWIDTFLIQSKDKDTAFKDALEMKEKNDEPKQP